MSMLYKGPSYPIIIILWNVPMMSIMWNGKHVRAVVRDVYIAGYVYNFKCQHVGHSLLYHNLQCVCTNRIKNLMESFLNSNGGLIITSSAETSSAY